jgi:hypothetical protein
MKLQSEESLKNEKYIYVEVLSLKIPHIQTFRSEWKKEDAEFCHHEAKLWLDEVGHIIDITERRSKMTDYPDEFLSLKKYRYFIKVYETEGLVPIIFYKYWDALVEVDLRYVVLTEIEYNVNGGSDRQRFKKENFKILKTYKI